MGRFGIDALIVLALLAAQHCSSTKTKPEQLFRDNVHLQYTPATQWNNPAWMSQAVTTGAFSTATAEGSNSADIGASQGVPQINQKYAGYYDARISDLIASSVLRFALDIGQKLSENTPNLKSEVFSPLSIMSALSMLMLGAKGKSYQELSRLFGLDRDAELRNNPSRFHEEFGYMIEDLQDVTGVIQRQKVVWRNTIANNNIRVKANTRFEPNEHIIKVANGVFTQSDSYNLNPNYRLVLQSVYHAQVQPLDFQNSPVLARDYINAWVSDNTFGKIPNIISDDIPRGTNAILASALYFKGFWENNFIEAATILDDFYPDGPQRRSIKVNMMATGGVLPFYDAKEYNCRIIGLPYRGNVTTMYVIQPYQSTRETLRQLQNALDERKIEDLIAKMTQKTAVLAFPKMHFVRSINMKSLLNQLGVRDIFVNGYSDLSLIGGIQRRAASERIPSAPQTAEVSQHPLKFSRPITGSVRDIYRESPLIFSRSTDGLMQENIELNKASTEESQGRIAKREAIFPAINPGLSSRNALNRLEAQRLDNNAQPRSDLFVEDIAHKVDFDVNEHGTEAAAATITYLKRSGTDVLFRADAPFLVLLRHDPTKLVLFYGIINEPLL